MNTLIKFIPKMYLFILISFLISNGIVLISSKLSYADDSKSDPNTTVKPELFQGLKYRMIGPHRGGRVTAVTGVPGNPTILYFGGTGGGVWKTTTYGRNYKNVSDGYFSVGSIGAIGAAKSNPDVLYVGTGSACIRSNVSTGRGVYKSEDGAKTWSFIGLPEAGQIGKLVIDPNDPNLVYIAALGHAFGPNPERGIYRSKDGGTNWERVLFISDSTGAVDLSMNPSNPLEIYAVMWRAERKPWTIISGALEGGLYKTTNGGDTWLKLTTGLPGGLIGKIAVSVSPANPQRVYVLVEAPDDEGGLYRSDDAGLSFQFINPQKSLTYRPFYYTHITADPNDENTVYINNEGFFKSVDGGRTFDRIRTPHGDNHDMWIHPEDSNFLFQANDGGVNVSFDGGKTWSEQYNQATAELYHVVVDNQFPYWVYGEQQDNSTIMVPSIPPTSNRPISPKQFWRAVAGCETGPIAIHPLDPNIVYGGCKGRFSRYNHATGQEMQYWVYPHFNYGHAASEMPYRFQRTSPIELSPHNPQVIYHTSQYVHKTKDEGRTWETISPDLTANDPTKQVFSGGPITRDITGEEIYSTIYAFRESLFEEGVLWVGSNDGLFHISRDGGKNWKNITPKGLLPGGRVQTIDPSPHEPGRALAAVYRYMLDDWSPYIFLTNNYGEDWQLLTDGTNGIPSNEPTRVVREDPNRKGLLYVGTEFGMFVSFDDGEHWQSFQLNLPATPITDIKVHHKDLVLSTMGRSFWIMDNLSTLHQIDNKIAEAKAFLFKPRDAYRTRWSNRRAGDDGASPEYPPNGAMIDYYLAEKASEGIILEVLDTNNNIIQTYSSPVETATRTDSGEVEMSTNIRFGGRSTKLTNKPGMHRFVWNLRYTGPVSLQRNQFGGQGPFAVPGSYRVRLRVGDWSQEQNLIVMIDPRVAKDNVTIADLQEQFDLNIRIRDSISQTNNGVIQIRSVRSQLDSIKSSSQEDSRLAAKLGATADRLTAIEEELVQTKEGKVGAQLKPKLYRQLTYLNGMTTRADQKLGKDAFLRFDDIEKILKGHLSELQKILNEDVAELNKLLKNSGKEIIDVDGD